MRLRQIRTYATIETPSKTKMMQGMDHKRDWSIDQLWVCASYISNIVSLWAHKIWWICNTIWVRISDRDTTCWALVYWQLHDSFFAENLSCCGSLIARQLFMSCFPNYCMHEKLSVRLYRFLIRMMQSKCLSHAHMCLTGGSADQETVPHLLVG